MRRICFSVFLSALFCFLAQAQVSFQLGPNGSLLGNPFEQDVAFYHESTYPVIDQVGEWNFKLGSLNFGRTVNLNEKGQYQSALTYFGEDAQVYMNTQFEYDDRDRIKGVTEKFIYAEQPMLISYDWEPKASIPTTATLEMNGTITQEISYDSRKRGHWEETVQSTRSSEKTVIEREKNRIQAYRIYNGEGSFKERLILSYNEKGLEQLTTIYDPQDEVIGQLEYTYLYDEKGNWIKRLQHDKRNGTYSLAQRQVGYRQQLAEAEEQEVVAGLWHSVNQPMKLLMGADGTFTLFELGEDVMTNGTWTDNGWGQAELKMGKSNRIRFKNFFQQGWKFTAELEPGRLIMHRDGRHYEFVADWFAPAPEGMIQALAHAQWEETLWAKPGHRDPKAIPAALQKGFTSVLPVAPNRFVACVADNLCGLVDETAYPLIPFAYDLLTLAFPEHYVVHKDGKRGLVDSLGQIILPIKYESIWTETAFGKLVIGTRENGKRYYYDLEKNTFWPYEKESIMGFNDDRFVINEEYWFLTDKNFEPISTEEKYYNIKILSPDRYLAMTTRRAYQIIDAEGMLIANITGFESVRKTVFGYLTAQVKENRLYALFDHDGQQLTEPIYENLQFCTSRNRDGDLCDELRKNDAFAKYRKPNGEEGFLNGMGREVE